MSERKKIVGWLAGLQEREVKPGVVVEKVGKIYVHIQTMWTGGKDNKLTFDEFRRWFVLGYPDAPNENGVAPVAPWD